MPLFVSRFCLFASLHCSVDCLLLVALLCVAKMADSLLDAVDLSMLLNFLRLLFLIVSSLGKLTSPYEGLANVVGLQVPRFLPPSCV